MSKFSKSESRTEYYSKEQLRILGWDLDKEVLEKQEVREVFPDYRKKPEFVLLLKKEPKIVIECKGDQRNIEEASKEAKEYAGELNIPIAIGVAGDEDRGVVVQSWYEGKRICYKQCALTQFLTKKHVEDLLSAGSHELDNIEVPPERIFYTEAEYISNQFRGAHVDKRDMARYLACFILALFYEKDIVMAMSSKGNAKVINELLNKLSEHLKEKPDVVNVLKIHNATSSVIEKLMFAFPKIISSLRRLNIEALMRSKEDIIGLFFENFLRYSNDKKELGIVFTPRHIVRFMCDIISPEIGDRVLDPCCGTGGFLVTAYSDIHRKIGEEFGNDPVQRDKQWKELANKCIYGIESETSGEIIALAIVNMIIRGDGKTNIIAGSCFDGHKKMEDLEFDKVLLNPPYSQKKKGNDGKTEEEFLDCALLKLRKGGLLCAIIPYSVLSKSNSFWGRQLIEKHRIEAVFSVPIDLFYPISMPTVVVLIRAHIPQAHSLTFMARIDNDGYKIDRKKRSKEGEGDIPELLGRFKSWKGGGGGGASL